MSLLGILILVILVWLLLRIWAPFPDARVMQTIDVICGIAIVMIAIKLLWPLIASV